MSRARIAVFASGGGTNLQALIDAEQAGALPDGTIALVIADKPGIGAIERAERAGIPAVVIPRKEEGFEEKVLAALRENDIDMGILAGFLGILSADFLRRFDAPVLNIHPSLIPSFCGKGFYGLKVHKAALDYGVKVTGATVHYVNEIPDGGKIILQKAVEVEPDDSPATLQRRVMEQAEWVILPQAAQMVAAELNRKKGGPAQENA
ncbi:MAG: phosphoribosylglycinamide formyltransferase [Clostridia bacterium]|nr:phosphoribosylglycinamide formyltransferase [Clostridia bacterium]